MGKSHSDKSDSPPVDHASSSKDGLWGLLLGLIGVLIFSGTLPATRFAVEVFDPGFLTFGRAVLAGIAAALTLFIIQKPFPTKQFVPLLYAGLALIFAFPGFMALAMVSVPSAHGSVVLGILPLTTAIFASLIAGERPSILFWVCGLIGTILIVVFAIRDGAWGFEIGDFWLLAAALSASSGYVVSAKLTRLMPGWEVISWALVLWFPISVIGAVLLWSNDYLAAPAAQIWSFAYVSFGSMFLGFFAWNTGLKLGGIAKVGQLQLLQTFFTLAIAALFLGEVITLETVGFAVAVLAVVVIGRKAQVNR